jgi:hypothetical protein
MPGALAPGAVADAHAEAPLDEVTASMGAARIAVPRADVDLPQLDSDLARLEAQAANVSRDAEGFRRRAAQAEAKRQACQEQEACLRQWHAQRRRQLLGEF